jgi:hypothetical protein
MFMLQTGTGNDRRCREEELDCSWEGLLIVIALKLLDIIVSIRCLNFLNFSNLFIHVILDDFDRAHIW